MAQPLQWGLVGGGPGSQIGEPHRIAARLDGLFHLAAGALDIDAGRGRAFARELGVTPDRAYGNWQEMLEAERQRADGVDLVTVATPNATHYEIAREFLAAGIPVLCEKPMTMTPEEARQLVELSERTNVLLTVNFGYCGFPMVRQARAMVGAGELGAIRLIVAEFAHGFHADASQADNPRLRWRYDPAQAGVSSVLADAGIHALHMAGFVAGQSVESVSAHFASLVAGRALEDDAAVMLRFSGGALGRLWASAVAVGQMHGLNIRIFGERGGLRWHQEQPGQLFWTPLGGTTRILERGAPDLDVDAAAASRFAIGHTEGLPVAFANIYRDIHAVLTGRDSDGRAVARLPRGAAGAQMVFAVHAAARSASEGGTWVDLADL